MRQRTGYGQRSGRRHWAAWTCAGSTDCRRTRSSRCRTSSTRSTAPSPRGYWDAYGRDAAKRRFSRRLGEFLEGLDANRTEPAGGRSPEPEAPEPAEAAPPRLIAEEGALSAVETLIEKTENEARKAERLHWNIVHDARNGAPKYAGEPGKLTELRRSAEAARKNAVLISIIVRNAVSAGGLSPAGADKLRSMRRSACGTADAAAALPDQAERTADGERTKRERRDAVKQAAARMLASAEAEYGRNGRSAGTGPGGD